MVLSKIVWIFLGLILPLILFITEVVIGSGRVLIFIVLIVWILFGITLSRKIE